MKSSVASSVGSTADPSLVRQVNQLYHELVHTSFDRDHRYRHRVERSFWREVARRVLGPKDRPARARTRETARSHPGRVVVDLACGTGFVTETLTPWLGPNDQLIAIDLSGAPLKTAADKWRAAVGSTRFDPHRPGFEPVVGDGQALPLAERSVDLLAINASLHHLIDPSAALRAIDRVLKPGGYFALGFEPNRAHFDSSLAGLSRGFTRACWYASPSQNWRRLRTWSGRVAGIGYHPAASPDDVLTTAINKRLLGDGSITQPLTTQRLLDLVDPHARGAAVAAGFDPARLLGAAMPDYQVVWLDFHDYLGETARRWPIVRELADGVLRTARPHQGSLFCWLVRKPSSDKREGRS